MCVPTRVGILVPSSVPIMCLSVYLLCAYCVPIRVPIHVPMTVPITCLFRAYPLQARGFAANYRE